MKNKRCDFMNIKYNGIEIYFLIILAFLISCKSRKVVSIDKCATVEFEKHEFFNDLEYKKVISFIEANTLNTNDLLIYRHIPNGGNQINNIIYVIDFSSEDSIIQVFQGPDYEGRETFKLSVNEVDLIGKSISALENTTMIRECDCEGGMDGSFIVLKNGTVHFGLLFYCERPLFDTPILLEEKMINNIVEIISSEVSAH